MVISPETFKYITWGWILLALIIFPVLFKINPPYGRHSSKKWGARINNRTGWILMELPTLILFILLFLTGDVQKTAVTWIFFSVWMLHYVNRIFIFPMRIRTKGKKMPLAIIFSGIFFNLMNSSLNGYWLGYMAYYPVEWIKDPRFILGFSVFVFGYILNQRSDTYLISLRKGGKTGYYIPQKGFFKYISCPNYLGEMMEWIGFGIMTWSLPGLSFAIWTIANLLPRALHHHKWYFNTFPDYPKNRKALIPCIL